MAVTLTQIQSSISEILQGLRDTGIQDKEKTKNKKNIAILIEQTTKYLNKKDSGMSPWEKDQIFHAVSGVYWGCFGYALNAIQLAISDPSTVAQENEYPPEIVSLEYEDFIKKIKDLNV